LNHLSKETSKFKALASLDFERLYDGLFLFVLQDKLLDDLFDHKLFDFISTEEIAILPGHKIFKYAIKLLSVIKGIIKGDKSVRFIKDYAEIEGVEV